RVLSHPGGPTHHSRPFGDGSSKLENQSTPMATGTPALTLERISSTDSAHRFAAIPSLTFGSRSRPPRTRTCPLARRTSQAARTLVPLSSPGFVSGHSSTVLAWFHSHRG